MAFTPRLSSVRPAGPTHITAGHRPKASAAQDSWRRPFAKALSSSTDDIQAIRDLIELIREHAALKSRVVLAMMASGGAPSTTLTRCVIDDCGGRRPEGSPVDVQEMDGCDRDVGKNQGRIWPVCTLTREAHPCITSRWCSPTPCDAARTQSPDLVFAGPREPDSSTGWGLAVKAFVGATEFLDLERASKA